MEGVSTWDKMLYNSSRNGDKEGVITALAQGGRVTVRGPRGITPLLIAVCHGHTDICGLLLAHGSNVNDRETRGGTPLLAAANKGHTDICGLLLAHGSNVNEVMPNTKHTALHYAAGHGDNGLLEALLSWGAEINPQSYGGATPLHTACQGGNLLCVLTLLKAGASLTVPNKQDSLPIHIAAQTNNIEIVRTFLEHGCSPDMVSWYHTG